MTQDGRVVVDAYAQAMQQGDFEAARRLCHPDLVVEWPQTGERITGRERVLDVDRAYPGGLPKAEMRRVVGSDDRWVMDAGFVPRRILGSGDVWSLEATFTYSGGDIWEYVAVVELRDGRIVAMTEYWAPRSEPPDWRVDMTERTR